MGMRKPYNLSEKAVMLLCKLGVAAMDTFLDTYATHKEATWKDPQGELFARRMRDARQLARGNYEHLWWEM